VAAGSTVDIVSRLGLHDSQIVDEFLAGARGLPPLQYIQTGCGVSTATTVTGAGGPSLGVKWPEHEGVHCHLVPSLRMNGAALLLPPYSVIASTGTTFPLHLANRSKVETVKGCEEVNVNCLRFCGKHQHSQFVNSSGLCEVLQHHK
jgi:hypothetical protein